MAVDLLFVRDISILLLLALLFVGVIVALHATQRHAGD